MTQEQELLAEAVSFILDSFSDGNGTFTCPISCPICNIDDCSVKSRYETIIEQFNK